MREAGLGLYQSLIHDWDKLTDLRLISAYSNFFARKETMGYMHKPGNDFEYDYAWLRHLNRNPHHWQYWAGINGSTILPLRMPKKFVLEMVADWRGANLANGGNGDAFQWYFKNVADIHLHPDTRNEVEELVLKYHSLITGGNL